MTELRLQLLGVPEASLDGRPVRFRRRASLLLLAYLALTGRRAPRSMLAALLAGDLDEETAQKRVRNTLNDLRTAVGDHLAVTREWVAFDRERPHRIDVVDLEAQVAAGANPPDGDGAAPAALDLHRGEFLSGVELSDAPAFDEWLVLQREHVHQAQVQAHQAALQAHLRGGPAAAAAGVAIARRLLEAEPWSEDAHRALMTLLARSGQRGAALAQYAACRRVLAAELGVDPAPETAALAARLRSAPAAIPHNLPAPAAGFRGRGEELALVAARLADPACRLVTLVGLGGSGKTALAVEAARRALAPAAAFDEAPFPDGVFVVPLGEDDCAPSTSPPGPADAAAGIAAAIGRVVGAPESRAVDRLTAVIGRLRSKRLLLVVDRLDQHLAGVGALAALLRQVAGVKLIATSRVRLHLQGETVCELRGLPVPAGADDLERSAAGRLFLEEAARVRPDAPLGPADRAAAAAVCRLLGGHPLALLLAASTLRGLACADLAADLAAGRELPAAPLRDRPARQHSLRAVLDAAWAPLSDAERAILRRLAVFRGPFSRAAAAAAADAAPSALLGLIDAGLLDRVDGGRYALSALVHRDAADRLAADPAEAAATAARHAAFYAADGGARPPASPAGADPADQGEDVRAAWDWSAAHGRPDLLDGLRPSLVRLYDQRGAWAEAAHCLETAADRLRASLMGDAPGGGSRPGGTVVLAGVLAACLVDLAHFEIQRSQLAPAGTTLHEARGFAAAFRLPTTEAWAALRAGQLLLRQGQRHAARQQLEPVLAFGRELGLQRLQGEAARALGALAAADGDLGRAAELGEHALRCARGTGDALAECRAGLLLGEVAAQRGDLAGADASLAATLTLADRLGAPTERVLARLGLGAVLGRAYGRPDAAEYLLAEALDGARALESGHDLEARVLLASARLARADGHLSRARSLAEQALECSRGVADRGGRGAEAEALGELATLAHLDGDDRRALALAAEALQAAAQVDCGRTRQEARLLSDRIRDGLARAGAPGADGRARGPGDSAVDTGPAERAPSLA